MGFVDCLLKWIDWLLWIILIGFFPFSSERWTKEPGMAKLNDLGGYEKLQQHMVAAHNFTKKDCAALAPLINCYSTQLLYEIAKEELRYSCLLVTWKSILK